MKKIFLITIFFLFSAQQVSADAWWGSGARPDEWILRKGGTLIHYKIKGGNDDDYKARMTQGGKYVEVEFGDKGKFDDAKDGTYEVTFYKCKKDAGCIYQKTNNKQKVRSKDKKFASIVVRARPGQTLYLSVDKKGGPVSVTTESGKPLAPPKPKKTAAEIADEEALAAEGKFCTNPEYNQQSRLTQFLLPQAHKRSERSDQIARAVNVLPDYTITQEDGVQKDGTDEFLENTPTRVHTPSQNL